MASTRNKNTQGDYYLQTRENALILQTTTYEHGAQGRSRAPYHAGDGIHAAPRMTYLELSENGVDIESYLHGTGSTNLVNPAKEPFQPQLKQLKSLCLYKKNPTILPTPLVVEKDQRPLF